MAWNEPGNGKDQDPWGNKGKKNQEAPDLEEVLKKFFNKLSGASSGGKSKGGFPGLGFSVILLLVGAFVVFNGFYTVKEAERGVLLRFGEYTGELVQPGLHWRIPVVDQVTNVNVQQFLETNTKGEMLTQDENVVLVEMNVQYRIADPERYLFSVTDAPNSLNQAIDSALRSVVGHTSMDQILTKGREKVREDTRAELERIIKPYNMGIKIEDVNFLPARPPEAVKDAFDDAIAAQEDEQRFIRLAEAYAKEQEPKARGRVESLAKEAEAYKQKQILKATGEISLFEQLLPEYKRAPEVTRQRLYLETMETVYGNTSKVLIDSTSSGNMMYLPIDKLLDSSSKPRSNSKTSAQKIQDAISASEQALNYSSDITIPSNSNRSSRSSRGRN